MLKLLYTRKTAAAALGVTTDDVDRMVRQGKLRIHNRRANGQRVFYYTEIEAAVEALKSRRTTQPHDAPQIENQKGDEMYEKLTERKHIRLPESIVRKVARLAEREVRSYQDQLRFLIELGLKYHKAEGNGLNATEDKPVGAPRSWELDHAIDDAVKGKQPAQASGIAFPGPYAPPKGVPRQSLGSTVQRSIGGKP
jgi:hypothetical protein